MNESEAWKVWHATQAARRDADKAYRQIKLDIERIELWQLDAYAKMYATDKAFMRTLSRMYGFSEKAWRGACRCDGRLLKLINRIGWEKLAYIIKLVRTFYEQPKRNR